MNVEDMSELVDWIADRFPDSQWHAEQALAYLDDLEEFDAVDVWSSVNALYETGLKFAPTGSEIVKRARVARRRSAQETLYKSLPEPERDPDSTWDSYVEYTFKELIRPQTAIERLHTARTDCKSSTCPIHNESVDA